MCIDNANVDNQKFPWLRQHNSTKGIENNVENVVMYPLVIGYFLSNLSPIIPAKRFDVNPKIVKLNAFIYANSALNAG